MYKEINETSMSEQPTSNSSNIDDLIPVKFPALFQRYFAALVDLIFVFFSAYLVSTYTSLFESASLEQFIVILLLLFTYDALFTSKLCTLGQLLLNFRVRNRTGLNKIAISTALLRSAIKILLGGYSLIAMIFNQERRAVHDFVTDTLVIFPGDSKP
jgi:uncharacterized RDD family membrane protein YckC